jgi:hypothetical protein
LGLNFKEALAALARAFPAYLFYATALVLGGLLVLVEFGLALFAVRLVRIAAPVAAGIVAASILLGGWLTMAAWQRLFLYRRKASLLVLFSGAEPLQVKAAAESLFPSHSAWARRNRRLRQALFTLGLERESTAAFASRIGGRLPESVFSPAILSLAFARGNEPEVALREALSLYGQYGGQTRILARRWLGFSAITLALLFLCLALPNWFFFKSAGAPVAIGVALAAVIAWFLHQAFICPLALAGVSASLFAETKGRESDANLREKIAPLLTL